MWYFDILLRTNDDIARWTDICERAWLWGHRGWEHGVIGTHTYTCIHAWYVYIFTKKINRSKRTPNESYSHYCSDIIVHSNIPSITFNLKKKGKKEEGCNLPQCLLLTFQLIRGLVESGILYVQHQTVATEIHSILRVGNLKQDKRFLLATQNLFKIHLKICYETLILYDNIT